MDGLRRGSGSFGLRILGRGWVVASALMCATGLPPLWAAGPPPDGSGRQERFVPKPAFFVEVMVLHGTNSKKGIDARIGSMPELRKPPFSSYDSYAFLNRARLPLDNHPRKLKLPNGRVLQTRLTEVLAEDSLRFAASINQPNGKDFLPLLEVKAQLGQPFIVAGQSYRQGILVLVIRAVR